MCKMQSNLTRFTNSLGMFSKTFGWAPPFSDSGNHLYCYFELKSSSVGCSFAAAKSSASRSFLGNTAAAAAAGWSRTAAAAAWRCSALLHLAAAAAAGSQTGRVGRAGWSAGPTVLDLQEHFEIRDSSGFWVPQSSGTFSNISGVTVLNLVQWGFP